ncbi:MAG: acetylxylan esterase [Planctomycetaceae bacterium]|jgi:cephalosporin-C deacetylase-like acetyl esterase|nr:acetylxylan esterase [Planctomycetaceae bacterium]
MLFSIFPFFLPDHKEDSMKHLHRFPVIVLITLFCFVPVSAQQKAPLLEVRAEKDDALYKKGETATFRITLTEDGKCVAGQELWYALQGDGNYNEKGSLTTTDTGAAVKATLPHPGFVRCFVGGEVNGTKISGIGGAGFSPLEITTKFAEPADFDEFWNSKKDELAKIPMNPKLVKVTQDKVPNVEVYDVKVDCLGGMPVSGYFAKPAGAKPKTLPIIMSYHGAGVRSAGTPLYDAAKGALAMDVNAHGIENGQPAAFYTDLANGKLKDYRIGNSTDREKVYFTGMYLRVIRSLQFMKSQPEWDGKILVVRGGSQGGGQSLVAAGIDPDVTFCCAYVPALCYPLGGLEGNFDGWPGFLRGKTEDDADPAIVKAVPYVDVVNFAKRIKAECILSTGFIDTTCSATSVYLAYNGIKTAKQIFPTPEATHAVPQKTNEAANKLLWDYIEKNRVKQ